MDLSQIVFLGDIEGYLMTAAYRLRTSRQTVFNFWILDRGASVALCDVFWNAYLMVRSAFLAFLFMLALIAVNCGFGGWFYWPHPILPIATHLSTHS